MPLIVQKFGGTSVADTQKILVAARKAIRAQQEGAQVVVVVSAMGKNTDVLVDLAREISDNPPAREMDMLLSTGEQVSVALMAMAIESLGHCAISLTGAQMGIRTDSTHTKARIHSISTERMRKALSEGKIVIATGFQGIDQDYNITTLGRGGSDTTAVALAAVLEADACEIYTDVDGIYTTDPRALPEARRVGQISYDEMLELASLGAGVMHSRSIEFAKKFGVPIHVRSSFTDQPGTLICAEPENREQAVCGASLVNNEARVTIQGVPDIPGASYSIFSKIANRNISVDMIVQNVSADGKADISFTVVRDELNETLRRAADVVAELGADGLSHDENVAKLSVVGLGMVTQAGVAERMFRVLADEGVNILMITTSPIKISVLVARNQAQSALRAVHRAFGLDKNLEAVASGPAPVARTSMSPTDILKRLQSMEGLTIASIDLDDSQGRVTINDVPDSPGIAAQLFEQVAAGGIIVDMIVQSFGSDGRANLSFTAPRQDIPNAVELAKTLAARLECGEITHSASVAKLTVTGIGMRSHTGVAIRMFDAMTQGGINVEMISTSEVEVTIVVDGRWGAEALERLNGAFSDVQR